MGSSGARPHPAQVLGSASATPKGEAPWFWILAPGSELKGYLRLCQLLLIW